MEPVAGVIVRERYELVEALGTGGFATVWLARDHHREQDVALKFPSFHAHDRETVLVRFERERRLLAPFAKGLSHATVVRYIDGALDADPRFLAFEYLSGEPLVDAFRSGSLGSSVRQRIVTDLAETLDFLHRNDIVYLDLKPENVILRRSGRPVLYDFNTAVRVDEAVDVRFGADQFKAPELLDDATGGPTVGPWSDVFSWGKLAFYLLTGVKVESADVPAEGLDPRSFGATCEAALAAVVQRATAPDGTERYADGMALADAVGRVVGRAERMVIEHPAGGRCAVGVDDTFGRLAEGRPTPWIVVADERGYVAAEHARFVRTNGAWALEDLSRNGTYIADGEGWTLVLSAGGYQAQCAEGHLDPRDPAPPAVHPLSPGATIAPVHPEYGIRLRVRPPG